MKYELHFFDQVINGHMSPFNQDDSDTTKFIRALKGKTTTSLIYTIASFKRTKGKFELLNEKSISSLHPVCLKLISRQHTTYNINLFDDVPPELFTLLKLKKKDVIDVTFTKHPTKTTAFIKQTQDLSAVSEKEARYYYYNILLSDEVSRIKSSIIETFFASSQSPSIEAYIHNQQKAIIGLCSRILEKYDAELQLNIYSEAVDFTDIDIFNLTFIKLEELLRFLEKRFLDFLDMNILVPLRSSLLEASNIHDKLDFIKQVLLSSNVNKDLLKITYVPFLKLSAITLEERLTYRDLIYCLTYLDAFHLSITENNNTIVDSQVRKIVYHVNYNVVELFNYIIDEIKNGLSALSDLQDRIDFLYLSLKVSNQRSSRLNIYCDKNLPSIKLQVNSWIEEEIAYLTKRQKTLSSPEINLFSEQETTKIQSGFTVAQLALFFKLQADVGIITNKIQKDIFRHIAENYRTSKVVDISFDSVSNRYYNIDVNAIEVLKEKTIEILNKLKEG